MNYTDFPQELRHYFQQNLNEDQDSTNLENLFSKNSTVREAFVAWAQENPLTVEYTPRLYKALEIANSSDQWAVVAQTVNSTYLWLSSDANSNRTKDILAAKYDKATSGPLETYIETALKLVDAGIISKNHFIRLLSIQDPYGDRLPLGKEKIIIKTLPFLEKLNPEELKQVLNFKNIEHNNVLAYPDTTPLLLPLIFKSLPVEDLKTIFKQLPFSCLLDKDCLVHLEKLDLKDFREIFDQRKNTFIADFLSMKNPPLSILDKLDPKKLKEYMGFIYSSGNPAIFHPTMLRKLLPFLQNQSPADLKEYLSIPAQTTLLHDAQLCEIILPLVYKLDRNDLTKMITQTDYTNKIPLDYPKIVVQLFPFLNSLNNSALMKLFCSLSEERKSIINAENAENFAPLLKKLNSAEITEIFLTKDSQGNSVLHDPVVVKKLLPFFNNLNKSALLELFCSFSAEGKNIINAQSVESLVPFIKKTNPDELTKIFLARDSKGNSVLHDPVVVKNLLPFFNSLNKGALLELFCSFSAEGKNIINAKSVESLAPFIKKINPEELTKIFLARDSQGNSVLHDPVVVKNLLPILANSLSAEHLITFFSRPNNAGTAPLHNSSILEECLPLLNQLKSENLNQLFSIQYNQGNTLLHNFSIFEKVRPLLAKLDENVLQIQNKLGFTPIDILNKVSEKWLFQDKLGDFAKPLTEKEYQEKVKLLKQTVDKYWDSLVFGSEEGMVPNEYLMIQVESETKIFAPEKIKESLDIMIDRIVAKKPFVGTPQEDDSEGLLRFYSPMLRNLESVLSMLNDKSPDHQAGTLIGIAIVQMEGRCAAAYQSEIAQAKMLLDPDIDGSGLEAIFNKAATGCLIRLIEDSTKDSHDFSQMLYSVGLLAAPDPLSKRNIDECQKKILSRWTTENIIFRFKSSINSLDSETLQYWFYELMPPKFKEDLLLKQIELKKLEQDILEGTKANLQNKGVNDSLINMALDIFKSTAGAGLRVNEVSRKFVSEPVFQKISKATTSLDIQEAEKMQQEQNTLERDRRVEIRDAIATLKSKELESLTQEESELLKTLGKEQIELQQKSMHVGRELIAMKVFAQARIEFQKLIVQAQDKPISQADLETLIIEKRAFDAKIFNLANEHEVDFTASESGLPSRALENNRRLLFVSQFFSEATEDKKSEMNMQGLVKILKHVGVLQNAFD